MLVPAHHIALRHLRRYIGLSLLVLLSAAPTYAARGPDVRIPLEPLGFQTLNPEFLANGGTMLTVHFVDDRHLLLTFNARTLLKRIADDPPDDLDRNVAALLLELPSGRILARTEWRLHDHSQYLWNLPHGRFLLRIRDSLTTIAPLANLATGEPFHQRPFLNLGDDRKLGALFLSPDSDFLIIETKRKQAPKKPPAKPPLFGPAPPPSHDVSDESSPANLDPVQINFYRLATPPGPGDEVWVRSAGVGRSRAFGAVPATVSGYLELIDQGHRSWAFNFNNYAGKISELSPFDSTCRPSPVFVSHSEFIAFGCHLNQTRQTLGGFNMHGEEMWEQGLFGEYIDPYLVFAPSSGRFALGRVMSTLPVATIVDTLTPEMLKSQTVVVYQTDSGNQILKVECSPIERAGQNFALSPDGLSLSVVHADAIEIYKLPPLTPKEQAAVKRAQTAAPEATDLPVRLSQQPPSSEADDKAYPVPASQSVDATASTAPNPPSPAATTATTPPAQASSAAPPTQNAPQQNNTSPQPPTSPGPAASPTPPQNASGDPQPNQPRKPPTLYTLPTDASHDPPRDNSQPR